MKLCGCVVWVWCVFVMKKRPPWAVGLLLLLAAGSDAALDLRELLFDADADHVGDHAAIDAADFFQAGEKGIINCGADRAAVFIIGHIYVIWQANPACQ